MKLIPTLTIFIILFSSTYAFEINQSDIYWMDEVYIEDSEGEFRGTTFSNNILCTYTNSSLVLNRRKYYQCPRTKINFSTWEIQHLINQTGKIMELSNPVANAARQFCKDGGYHIWRAKVGNDNRYICQTFIVHCHSFGFVEDNAGRSILLFPNKESEQNYNGYIPENYCVIKDGQLYPLGLGDGETPIPEEEEPEEEEPEEEEPEEVERVEPGLSWLWWFISIIVVINASYFFISTKPKNIDKIKRR